MCIFALHLVPYVCVYQKYIWPIVQYSAQGKDIFRSNKMLWTKNYISGHMDTIEGVYLHKTPLWGRSMSHCKQWLPLYWTQCNHVLHICSFNKQANSVHLFLVNQPPLIRCCSGTAIPPIHWGKAYHVDNICVYVGIVPQIKPLKWKLGVWDLGFRIEGTLTMS